jgi:hypothetical protein
VVAGKYQRQRMGTRLLEKVETAMFREMDRRVWLEKAKGEMAE